MTRGPTPYRTHQSATHPPWKTSSPDPHPARPALSRRRLLLSPSPSLPSPLPPPLQLALDQNPSPWRTQGHRRPPFERASPGSLLGISSFWGGRRSMGGAFSGGAAPAAAAGEYPVVLNVYDLTPLNNYLHWCGLGIFHSAVEVHGSEYSFGAHDLPTSGVFEVEPKNCPGFLYRSSIFIGRTSLHPLEFREFIQRMASEYHGDTYHLISKNCNHFTDDLSIRLTGKPIPGWVNRLAKLGAFCNCLLPESMRLESTETKNLADCHFSDGSHTTSSEHFEDDDLEDKHLLSQSSVGEDAIVKEVHR